MRLRAVTRASSRLPLIVTHLTKTPCCFVINPAVGSPFPKVEVDKASWPPTAFDISEYIANKKVIIVGLPGAFTPT